MENTKTLIDNIDCSTLDSMLVTRLHWTKTEQLLKAFGTMCGYSDSNIEVQEVFAGKFIARVTHFGPKLKGEPTGREIGIIIDFKPDNPGDNGIALGYEIDSKIGGGYLRRRFIGRNMSPGRPLSREVAKFVIRQLRGAIEFTGRVEGDTESIKAAIDGMQEAA